jgi:hypothetical protein
VPKKTCLILVFNKLKWRIRHPAKYRAPVNQIKTLVQSLWGKMPGQKCQIERWRSHLLGGLSQKNQVIVRGYLGSALRRTFRPSLSTAVHSGEPGC